jgi:hypothetical protein
MYIGGIRPKTANNSLVMTVPARRSFTIIARHKGFVCCFGFVLPVKARVRPHKLGVSCRSACSNILVKSFESVADEK